MKTFGFGLSALLITMLWAPQAAAHALSCTNPYKYVYYTDDSSVASRCKYSYDENCNWKSTAGNCKWQGSYKGSAQQKPAAAPAPAPTPSPTQKPAAPKANIGFNISFNFGSSKEEDEEEKEESKKEEEKKEVKVENTSYEQFGSNRNNMDSDGIKSQTAASKSVKENDGAKEEAAKAEAKEEAAAKKAEEAKAAAKAAELAVAKKEAKLAAQKVEEMKATMEEIKVANQNNAILYRSPDANIGSVDPRFNAFSAGVSGGSEDSDSYNSAAGGLLSKSGWFGKNGKDGKKGSKGLGGRGLASNGSSETDIAKAADASGASSKGEGSSAASDNPWVSYMDQTSKAGLIDRLRKNPGLRDSLRDRIAELQAKGDASGIVELMEEALASAEKESQAPNLDDLKPMGIMEAFSMDAGETETQIRSLLADLDTESDPQFLPQTSLFERVSVAHRRSLVRGTVKTTK